MEQQNRLYLFDKSNNVYSLYVPFEMFKNVVSFISNTNNNNKVI